MLAGAPADDDGGDDGDMLNDDDGLGFGAAALDEIRLSE